MAATEVPVSLIAFQVLNLSLTGGIIYFIAKGRLGLVFKNRADQYRQQAEKAKQEALAAEKEKKKWEDRLSDLKENFSSRLKEAEVNSGTRAEQILAETKEGFKLREKEVELSLNGQLRRVKNEIYQEVVKRLCEDAKTELLKGQGANSPGAIEDLKNARRR